MPMAKATPAPGDGSDSGSGPGGGPRFCNNAGNGGSYGGPKGGGPSAASMVHLRFRAHSTDLGSGGSGAYGNGLNIGGGWWWRHTTWWSPAR